MRSQDNRNYTHGRKLKGGSSLKTAASHVLVCKSIRGCVFRTNLMGHHRRENCPETLGESVSLPGNNFIFVGNFQRKLDAVAFKR